MLLSKSAEYGIQAVLSITCHQKNGPILAREIADEWGLPVKYLNKILLQLRRIGILKGTRGVGGGYVLAKLPGEITCLEIVEAIEGPLEKTPKSGKRTKTANRSKQKYIAFRRDMLRYVRTRLGKTTIKQLIS